MHKSKLIKTLGILNAKEIKRLLQFLKSPFYNSNPSIIKLYMILRVHYPDFSSSKLKHEKIFGKIFPDRKYEHQKMLNLMSDFTTLLEKYMVVLQLEKEKLEQKKLLVLSYAERPDCYDFFIKKNKEIEKYLDGLPFRDEVYFKEKQELNLRYFGHPGTDMHTDGKDALRHSIENFEAYKSLDGVKLKCALNAWSNTVGGRKSIGKLNQDLVETSSLYLIYQKLTELQRTPDGEDLLLSLINEYLLKNHLFKNSDQANILRILLNFSNRFANQGKSEFALTSFNLYKIGLENNCLLVQGKLKESIFHSIVTAGTVCEEFTWTKAFIDKYNHLLDGKVRKDALSLGMGQWYFGKTEYEQVVKVLRHSFSEPQDVFKSKSLLLRSWFEIYLKDDSYFDLLMTQFDSFEKYIRRNKEVSIRLAEGFLNFVGLSRKIVIKKLEGKNIEGVKTEIENTTNLVYRIWLLDKVE